MNNKKRRGEKATAFTGSSSAIIDDLYHRRHRSYIEGDVELCFKRSCRAGKTACTAIPGCTCCSPEA